MYHFYIVFILVLSLNTKKHSNGIVPIFGKHVFNFCVDAICGSQFCVSRDAAHCPEDLEYMKQRRY